MTLADLQSNISISAQNAVTGDINWVTGYTGFSSDFRLQAGWYIALKIDASTIEGALEGATITATYHGRDVTLDSDQIIIIRLAEGEDSITFTANKEGYTEGRLTLDFSGLDKQEVNQSVYLTSDTTGITISPMQFGNTKTISGQVPWDSTTSTNVMQLTAYPFFDVPSGTTYSLEGTYEGAGANIQITDGTFSTLDELDMTFSVPSEMIGQTNATFILMFEDPDSNRDYFTYDVTGLTLAPDPRPKVNITSDTQGITISPSTYATSKTATGQVPYDTTAQGNVLSIALTTSGTLPTGPYTIEVFAQGDVMQQPIWYVTGASTIPQTIPIPLTSNEVGTGKYITINTSGANDPEFSIITIDTSALTLETSPNLRPYIDFADNITYNNVTYTQSDFTSNSGTITRNSNNNNIIIDGATFKRASLDGGTTYGYYFLYTSLDNGAKTYDNKDIVGASMWSSIGGKSLVQPSMDSAPQKGLFQIGDVWSTPTGSNISIKTPTDSIGASITFQNCTFENKGPTPAGRDGIYVDYSGFTYNNVNYNASDFITGGTITRGSSDNNITITGATLKWNPLQGETTNAYYLPLIKNNSGQMVGSTGGIEVYAPIAKVQANWSISGNMGNFIDGTGTDVFVIKINSTDSSFNNYPIIIQNINESGSFASVNLKLENCTFEPAPTPVQAPDFSGIMAGDYGASALFEQTANYVTYYGYIPDGNYATSLASTTELTYVDSTITSGHTQYNYTMTDDPGGGDTEGIGYLTPSDPSNPYFGSRNWVDTGDNSYIIMWPGNGVNLSGGGTGTDYIYGDNVFNAFAQTGSTYNAYIAIWNATTLGDYHYIIKGFDHSTVVDISNSSMLIFALPNVTSNMSGRSIKFHLYNSTKTDYIIINIDISGVTATQVN